MNSQFGALGRRFYRGARAACVSALNFIIPSACPCCHSETVGADLLCSDCFKHMKVVGDPSCRRCAIPTQSHDFLDTQGVCPRCRVKPPIWRYGAAAFIYDEWSRKMILPLKYGDRTENARFLAHQIARSAQNIAQDVDVVVPVPLHRSRLRKRRYNQAALIARQLARTNRIDLKVGVLERTQKTKSLAGLSAQQRHTEIGGTITVSRKGRDIVSGRRVIVVDDVLTTGATLGQCAQALLDAGASSVDVAVAARTEWRADEQFLPEDLLQ